jgi:hypothetical protein
MNAGAFEKLTGAKMIPISSKDGKIYPDQLKDIILADRYPHQSVPKVSVSRKVLSMALFTMPMKFMYYLNWRIKTICFCM